MTREEAATVADKHGVHVEEGWGTGKIIAELFEECVEETLIQPIFVTDHPIEVSPLAKRKIGEDEVADRFELFISGHEYANAFNELNDPVDQAERFRAQLAAKDMGDDEAMGFDDDYVRALEYGNASRWRCGHWNRSPYHASYEFSNDPRCITVPPYARRSQVTKGGGA